MSTILQSPISNLQFIRERLALLLIALLPLHALFITTTTKILLGPGHPPYSLLSLWKEGLLGVILVLALVEIVKGAKKYHVSSIKYLGSYFDVIDVLIALLIIWSLFVSVIAHGSIGLTALGFRYDFVPLVAFSVLRRVEWSAGFRPALMRLLRFEGMVLGLYALLTLVLPMAYFAALGYSDLHSLYLPEKPLAAFQQIAESSIRRVQSTMSGPNQLGLWLLLPIAALMASWAELRASKKLPKAMLVGLVLLGALFFSFSRSAWIATMGIAVIAGWMHFGAKLSKKVVLSGIGALVVLGLLAAVVAPSAIVRLSSSRGHLERPIEAFHMMLANPLGKGLGTAGPASNRVSEACVMLRPQDDPSWAKDRPQLCVFVGDKQVQPLDHACKCPMLTENWYLQLGVEAGLIGFLLYLALTFCVLWELSKKYKVLSKKDSSHFSLLTFNFCALLAFAAISIGAVFLHAWEDAAVAWTTWLLIAVALKKKGD